MESGTSTLAQHTDDSASDGDGKGAFPRLTAAEGEDTKGEAGR